MKKAFYLSTCDTCKKILNTLNLPEDIELQDLKTKNIGVVDLEYLREQVSSYQDLLNKRARIYKELNLKERTLEDREIKVLILEHYTLLKRPVIVYQDAFFIGNSKSTKQELQDYFNE